MKEESNRVIFVDADQPKKSVFSIGQARHNFTTKHQVKDFASGFSKTWNPLEWKEGQKQSFDKKITTKVGGRE